MTAGEVGELESRRRRDDYLPGIWIVERGPGSLEAAWIPEQALVPAGGPRVGVGREAQLLAIAPHDRFRSFEEEHRLCRVFPVESFRERPRVGCAAPEPVDHPGSVRRGHEHVVEVGERRLQPNVAVDVRLTMVGAEHDRVALEELIGTARRVEERADRRVAPRQSFEGLVGTVRVRSEVVVRQVVDEEVEAVTGDEPPPDRGRVAVDRAV